MIAPDREFALTLTAAECNVVFNALSEAPYRIAAPIIDKMRQQITAADPGAFLNTPTAVATSAATPNGVDHAPD